MSRGPSKADLGPAVQWLLPKAPNSFLFPRKERGRRKRGRRKRRRERKRGVRWEGGRKERGSRGERRKAKGGGEERKRGMHQPDLEGKLEGGEAWATREMAAGDR